MDSIYTPSTLARDMVRAARVSLCSHPIVADFAAGSGELLIAARERWPMAQIIATDIDNIETQCLKKQDDRWKVGRCDFLNPKSRNSSPILKQLTGRVSLVLLNPPFSCRGGKRVVALAAGISVKCSIGLAFIVNSIDYLAVGGTLVAILPSGSLPSEKDSEAWKLLRKLCTVETILHNGHHTFSKATVDTTVIRLVKVEEGKRRLNYAEKEIESDIREPYKSGIRLVRGNIQMDEIENTNGLESIELIHSTELKEGSLIVGHRVTNKSARLITGPAVLIPRVGKLTKGKLICYTGNCTFALSDCILALQCPSKHIAKQIWQILIENWNLLEQAYSGSGAKYITIKKYTKLLRQLGYRVDDTKSGIEKK